MSTGRVLPVLGRHLRAGWFVAVLGARVSVKAQMGGTAGSAP